ncbi:MAG: hypothetical protein ACPG4K_07375 [Haloferula sp.]
MPEISPITWLLIGLAVLVLITVVDTFTGAIGLISLLRDGFRWIRSKVQKTIIIDTPSFLAGYILSGSLKQGSQLIVDSKDRWTGDQISHFAITSSNLPFSKGTVLEVVRIYPDHIELAARSHSRGSVHSS